MFDLQRDHAVAFEAPAHVFFVAGGFDSFKNGLNESFECRLIEASDIKFGFSACSNGVYAGTAFDHTEVESAFRIGRNLEFVNTDDGAGQAVNSRTDNAEFVEAVSAGAFENNAEAFAADSTAQNAVNIGGVDGDHAVIVILFFEERFAAA